MFSTFLALLIALATTAASTPLVRRLALAVGAVDEPTARRVHARRVPRMGGVAIVLGFFLPLLALYVLNTGLAQIFFRTHRLVGGLVGGSLVIVALGLMDDIVGVGAKRKLLVQAVASCLAYAGGLRIVVIDLPLVGHVALGWLSLPATILWITAIINALNLIDGLDGLAGGVAFFACVTNFVVAYINGNALTCFVSATLAGSILGFLIYNFNPATIFMGDSGSMFLGFMLACSSLLGATSQKSPTVVAILVPLLSLGLPITDMLFAIARRFLERRPIFSPDRGHIHHRLLDLGITHRRAVLLLYGLSLAFTGGALAVQVGRSWQVGAALLLLTVVLAGTVRSVGYFSSVVIDRSRRAARNPLVETMRRTVPSLLTQLERGHTSQEIPERIQAFAIESKLLAAEIAAGSGGRLTPWRWETALAGNQQIREAVCARFQLLANGDAPTELRFYWDDASGAVSPEMDILLQLVADAIDASIARADRSRPAARGSYLRTIA